MLISWLNVFQFLLTILSFILGYYLYATKRCYALSVYFFCLACHTALRMIAEIADLPVITDLSNTLRYIYAPLVYFSIRELLYQNFRYRPHHLLHLLPFTLALVFVGLNSANASHLSSLVGLLIVGYLLASYRLLFQFSKVVGHTRSSGTPSGLRWLRRVLYAYSALIVFESLRHILDLMIHDDIYHFSTMLFTAIICFFLTLLVYQGMRSPSLLPPINSEEYAITKSLESGAPSNRPLNPEVEQQLNQFMKQKKPFLNPKISVKELAEELGISSRVLSEVINEHYQCNFSEYINKARIAESQALMATGDGAKQSLLDIGLAAGFNSKTSFNVMFKRYTGDTPSNYRKQL
jgi:AraC-like DNA-binding protein